MSTMNWISTACGVVGGAGIAAAILMARTLSAAEEASTVAREEARASGVRLESRLEQLEQRLVELEKRRAAPPRLAESPAAGRNERAEDKPPEPAAESVARTESAPAPSGLDAILEEIVLSGFGKEETERLVKQLRRDGVPDDVLERIRAFVSKNSTDPRAHYLLARTYYARLMRESSPANMEKWGDLVLEEYEKASEIDPTYWEPRFDRAVYLSYYPETMGKAPEAIREFETLREQQKRSNADPHYAETYVYLARLYLRVNKRAKAEQTAREGLNLFPDNAALGQLIELLQGD